MNMIIAHTDADDHLARYFTVFTTAQKLKDKQTKKKIQMDDNKKKLATGVVL